MSARRSVKNWSPVDTNPHGSTEHIADPPVQMVTLHDSSVELTIVDVTGARTSGHTGLITVFTNPFMAPPRSDGNV